MRRIILLLASVLAALSLAAQPTGRMSFNDNWKFMMLDGGGLVPERYAAPKCIDASWRTVTLPHDWGVEKPFKQAYPGETGKLPWWGKAWYRKHFSLTPEDLEQEFRLGIDGAMSGAVVYCNGVEVGRWPYGYASFEVDLTPALHEGDNVVAVSLDNPEESSRWYPGGGIYRNVWLIRSPKLGIAPQGVCVTPAGITDGKPTVRVETTLKNHAGFTGLVRVTTSVFMLSDFQLSFREQSFSSVTDGQVVVEEMPWPTRLWSPDAPELYDIFVRVEAEDGSSVETYRVRYGYRETEWKPDGFYLNGERVFLKGVCLHHDSGALGAAWNDAVWERRLLQLKEMGCNAIRTSHNPPAPELLDLCDRLGFLVMDELTDTWTVPKKRNGYATLFDEWVEKDLVALIRRDRNHPSVILWSIGNEVGEQGYPDKWDIGHRLTAICHREDPTRLTTSGNDNLWAASTPYAGTVDVYGFNYKPHAYAAFRDAHPAQPFLGSETASCISTRGYYLFPVSDEKDGGWIDEPPFQVSSYDLYAPRWASKPDYEWSYEDQVPECAGEFVWTGFDYLGEPTPFNLDLSVLSNFHTEEEKEAYRQRLLSWGQKISDVPLPSRSSYFGIIDLAGFPKDRYWLYQARWRPDLPMVHIVPHWTWPGREGQVTPVHVYTSGDEAELFVNGKSQGRKVRGPGEYRLRWDDVVYQPGKVKVVAYKDGVKWAEETVRTAGKPRRARVSAEDGLMGLYDWPKPVRRTVRDRVVPQAGDLVFFTVRVTDRRGRLCPDADNLLHFSVEGPGEIIAVDNGDPTSHVPFYSKEMPAFHGLCAVIVRRTGPGRLILKVR